MADNFKDDDNLGDHWLSNWEQKTVEGWDSDSSLEERIQTENDRCKQKLWASFQTSASSISQLYKDGCQENSVALWVPFQNSASAVTILYKDSLDAMKKCFELGSQYATKRQKKEMLSWAKKKKRHLRREELIGYMCGKPPPPSSSHSRHGSFRTTNTSRYVGNTSPRLQSSRLHHHASHHPGYHTPSSSPPRVAYDASTADLQPFCDALALQRLDGAMSQFGLDSTSQANSTSTAERTREAPAGLATGSSPGAVGNDPESKNISSSMTDADFQMYLLNELTRRQEQNRKRQASAEQVLDSPTRKRSRFGFRDGSLN